jgi:hypothetical protein
VEVLKPGSTLGETLHLVLLIYTMWSYGKRHHNDAHKWTIYFAPSDSQTKPGETVRCEPSTDASWRLIWQPQLVCRHFPPCPMRFAQLWGYRSIYARVLTQATPAILQVRESANKWEAMCIFREPRWSKLGLSSDNLPQFIQIYIHICCERYIKI